MADYWAGLNTPADVGLPEKALQWVKEKWGADRPCPYCEDNHWVVDPSLVQVPSTQRTFSYLSFQVICTNCGNTVLLNAKMAELLPDDE